MIIVLVIRESVKTRENQQHVVKTYCSSRRYTNAGRRSLLSFQPYGIMHIECGQMLLVVPSGGMLVSLACRRWTLDDRFRKPPAHRFQVRSTTRAVVPLRI